VGSGLYAENFKKMFLKIKYFLHLSFSQIWDNDLATDAVAMANTCLYKHGQPSNRAFTAGNVGQNIGYSTENSANAETIFLNWMNESSYYNFKENTCKMPPCRHYTQASILW
jgi:hypothetical protein